MDDDSIGRFHQWRARCPHGIAVFCSHRTYGRGRKRVYRALYDWERGEEIYSLEPSKLHSLQVSAKQLRAALRPRILLADVVFAPATMDANNSGYMEWEIKTARSKSIPVLPVQFEGQQVLPRKIFEWCGRNPIPSALLRQRVLEALPTDKRAAFENWRREKLLSRRAA